MQDNFDSPLFKILAKNDSGDRQSNISGVLIPKPLRDWFPALPDPSPAIPVPSYRIRAALYADNQFLGTVSTFYRHQTWGQSRTGETRVTSNLGPLLDISSTDDILLFERHLDDPDLYRLTLLKQGGSRHSDILSRAGTRRYGPVDPGDPPVGATRIGQAVEEQNQRESGVFELFETSAATTQSVHTRIARSRAFSSRLLPLYDNRCAVCGRAHSVSDTEHEVEAAHIVPRSLRGADDARNGLVLCRSHHWAFDRGLFGIDGSGKIVLRKNAAAGGRNAHLAPFAGQRVRSPADPALAPAAEALAWHLRHIVNEEPYTT